MPSSETTASSETTVLKIFVGVLIVISLVGVAMLQPSQLDGWPRLVLLGLLTALASAWCVRIKALHLELTPTDPFVLFALATVGMWDAVVIALVAVGGATFWRSRKQRWACHLFNLTALPLSTMLAALVYGAMGGEPELPLAAMLGPLSVATLVYLLANTGTTAGVIALSGKKSFLPGWGQAFVWTLWPTVISLTLTLGMILMLDALGPLGLVLVLPPVGALAATHEMDRLRFESRRAADASTTPAGPA